MNVTAREAASKGLAKFGLPGIPANNLRYVEEGTYADTGEKWIEYQFRNFKQKVWVMRVLMRRDEWVAEYVVPPNAKQSFESWKKRGHDEGA